MIQAAQKILDEISPAAGDRAGIRLFTPEEAAEMFSVDKRTVLKWAREGKLESVKISKKLILFTRESINSFVNGRIQGIESVSAPKTKPRVRAEKSVKKGGVRQSSRKSSWRSLREEVTKWE